MINFKLTIMVIGQLLGISNANIDFDKRVRSGAEGEHRLSEALRSLCLHLIFLGAGQLKIMI